MAKLYFTPGPSQLYFSVPDHIKKALKEDVCSISHRSSAFKKIYAEAEENVRILLDLPKDHHILFLSSANEAWERILENLVENTSYHFVNGAFSKRFFTMASDLGKTVWSTSVVEGQGFDLSHLADLHKSDHFSFTHNETSTGVSTDLQVVYQVSENFPDAIISLDWVSSAPFPSLDFNKIDTTYFSVQKCFGLPAGLGVWTVSPKSVSQFEKIKNKGIITGSYHSLDQMLAKSSSHQTVETPNVLGIYLLAKVCADMLEIGIDKIRRDINYKAAVLYNTLEKLEHFKPFVEDPKYRSKTVIVAKTEGSSKKVNEFMAEKGMIIGGGYGEFKERHIRIANFPAHSNEQIEMLADALSSFEKY